MQNVKCVVVGDHGVGKTCFINTFFTNAFPGDYIALVNETFSSNHMVDGRPVNYGAWDTAGQDDYDRLRPLSYPHKTDIFILCFKVQSTTSFNHVLTKWYPEITEHCPGTPFIVCGLQTDVRNDEELKIRLEINEETMMTPEQGAALAQQLGARAYVECSALKQEGLKEAHETALHEALNARGGKRRKKRGDGTDGGGDKIACATM